MNGRRGSAGPGADREELAERVRAVLPDGVDVREVPMFGVLSFMIDGRLAVAARRDGGLLLHVDPAHGQALLDAVTPGLTLAEMGRAGTMGPGWLTVDPGALAEDVDLRRWIDLAIEDGATRAGGSSSGE